MPLSTDAHSLWAAPSSRLPTIYTQLLATVSDRSSDMTNKKSRQAKKKQQAAKAAANGSANGSANSYVAHR